MQRNLLIKIINQIRVLNFLLPFANRRHDVFRVPRIAGIE